MLFRVFALLSLIAGLSVNARQPASADDSTKLFQENCAACHMGEARGPDRIAPPIFAVKNHYRQVHQDKDGFIDALSAWILSPEKGKSLMPGAVRRFGLMEPVDLEETSARKIAEFIHSGEFHVPGWYAEHYRQEHGRDPD